MSRICEELGIAIIAEGIETIDEWHCLHTLGIQLMQGHLFGKPRFEVCVPSDTFVWPAGTFEATTVAPADECPDDPSCGVRALI